MIGIEHDIFKEGAAAAVGASTAIADLVGDKAREHYKKAFFDTLVLYMLRADQATRAWLANAVELSKIAAADGWTFDEFKDAIAETSKSMGLQ